MNEEELSESIVIRAGQRPAMMAWVPLNVFFVECAIYFLIARFFGFWTIPALAFHIIPVLLTEQDAYWPRTIWANFWHFFLATNRGLRGDQVVTFSAAAIPPQEKSNAE